MELQLDIGALLSAFSGGGGVWLAIRADVKGLRRDVDRLMAKVFK